jgi:hypothetical protein
MHDVEKKEKKSVDSFGVANIDIIDNRTALVVSFGVAVVMPRVPVLRLSHKTSGKELAYELNFGSGDLF